MLLDLERRNDISNKSLAIVDDTIHHPRRLRQVQRPAADTTAPAPERLQRRRRALALPLIR